MIGIRLLTLLILTAVGCRASRPPDPTAVRTVLDSTLAAHGRYAVARDIDGIVNQYTTDAVVRANHAMPLRGHDAIRTFVQGMLTNLEFQSLTYQTEQLDVHGDSAWHIVTYRVASTMAGQPLADSGSVFILWTRDSSRVWRIKDDIFNSYVPVAPPPR